MEFLDEKYPGQSPAMQNLRHVNDTFAGDVAPGDWAIRATQNVYGDGQITGLTYSDLRELEKELDRLPLRAVLAERVAIVNYVRELAEDIRKNSYNPSLGSAMAAIVDEIADKIGSYVTLPSTVS